MIIRKLAIATVIAAASCTTLAVAQAEDFPATPMNHGPPTNIPGMNMIPGANMAAGIATAPLAMIDGQPPMGGMAMNDQGAPMAEPGMRHHHRGGHHMMMKKKAMMKNQMMHKDM